MFTPAPIDHSFVPYTKRPKLKRNAGLFVDGRAGKGRGTARVVPQQITCVQHCNPNHTTDNMPCGPNCAGTCNGPVCS
jgi:hypothetical protein